MATKKTETTDTPKPLVEPVVDKNIKTISLTEFYSKKRQRVRFAEWLCGVSPLITHAWSEKAKREMLAKMVKAVKPNKEERVPQEEFQSSLYTIKDGEYGFPVTAVKKAILSVAHKDKGIAKTDVKAALWLNFDMVQARPALAGAICNMPIVRVYGAEPEMREDMVRIKGRGGSTANFAYRAQFWPWAIRLSGHFDPEAIPPEVLGWLIDSGGEATGIGDWRNEKSGIFGAFHMARGEEKQAWEDFRAGQGPLPAPGELLQAAE